MNSVKQNIGYINELILTLKDSYSYRSEVQEQMKQLNAQLSEVEKYKTQAEENITNRITALNYSAFALSRVLDREKFKTEDNKRKLDTFCDDMNTLEKIADSTSQLSPICYFLRALNAFNTTQYEPAQGDLEKVFVSLSREIAQPTIDMYSETSTESEIISQLESIRQDCNYHLGITYYNLGKFDEASHRFREAFRINPRDFRSRSYIPELKFFDIRSSFPEVISEFKAVERELTLIPLAERSGFDWFAAMASLKLREGNCYLPKEIRMPKRIGFVPDENALKAASLYREAFENVKNIQSRNTLTKVFVIFSLAQALRLLDRTEWQEQRPSELFQQVHFDIQNQLAVKTEPILLVLLNYSMAVCAKYADIQGENPRPYLSRAREQLQRVPASVLVFSPINKINLNRVDILWEMEVFEKGLS